MASSMLQNCGRRAATALARNHLTSELSATLETIRSGSQREKLQAWTTLAVLACQTKSRSMNRLALESLPKEVPDTLDAAGLPKFLSQLALVGDDSTSCDFTEMSVLRLACRNREDALLKETVDQDRVNFRLAMGRAWTVNQGNRSRQRLEEIVDRLGDEPYNSRKTFRRMTPARLVEMAYLMQNSSGPSGNFHKYYLLYKAYELCLDVDPRDLALVMDALRRRNVTVSVEHPIMGRFASKLFEAVADGRIHDEEAIVSVFLYFQSMIQFPKETLTRVQKQLFDHFGSEGMSNRLLMHLGQMACKQESVIEELPVTLHKRLQSGDFVVDTDNHCSMAAAIVSSKWLPKEDKRALASLVNKCAINLLRRDKHRYSLGSLKSLLTLGYLDGGYLEAEAVDAAMSNEMLTQRDTKSDHANAVKLTNVLLFSSSDYHRLIGQVVVHLWQVAEILMPNYEGSRMCLRPWRWQRVTQNMPGEEDFDKSRLHPKWRHLNDVADALQARLSERTGAEVVRQIDLPHFETVQLLIDLDGKRRAVVILDRTVFMHTCYASPNVIKDFIGLTLAERNSVDHVCFVDSRDIKQDEEFKGAIAKIVNFSLSSQSKIVSFEA